MSGFPLADRGAVDSDSVRGNVLDLQGHDVAASEFAVPLLQRVISMRPITSAEHSRPVSGALRPLSAAFVELLGRNLSQGLRFKQSL